ncbi:sensor histidine kinase [Caenimonas aquaedulcis]|uniref:histidine kinase n=1 Tax=Caenimonas aquaedulcis TaxID=2793270 RepID=A0A931H8H9_9BURK|nr:sensor histidine kinase [Caenimonas aquaedulcis]MBG9390655.1 sensor histidine kinase [Caenimonas aquaedulcis]
MSLPQPILVVPISAQSVASLRTQVREVARCVGLEGLQQTRFSTAVSEIARNAVQYAGGGKASFLVAPSPHSQRRQCVIAEITDAGPGIADTDKALHGFALESGRESMGIPGSRRLVDRMTLLARPEGGTLVRLEMDMPLSVPELGAAALAVLREQLSQTKVHSPLDEIQQQNRELLRIHQQLREKQTALEMADLRKNQFVTTLAHELRNPLATLDLSLTVLRLKPELGAAELLKRCEVMARQTAQLTQLVNDLMDVTRVTQGKVALRQDRTELNDLVRHAVEMTSAATQAKAQEVQVFAAPDPVWVVGDASRLTQVLGNLLQNAARYTPEGGSIAVKVAQVQAQAVVDVVDNGIGIAADLMPHVFDLFVQGDSRAAGGAGGLGIGLTLVRHLVSDHGGSVEVASEGVDRGSRFTVKLPVLDEAAFALSAAEFARAANENLSGNFTQH